MQWALNISSRLRWILFWVTAGAFYVVYFGRSAPSYADVLHLALPLLGIAILASWAVGRFLVPRYLLAGRYVMFGLFLSYTLVVTVFLVLATIVGAFMLFADYRISNMAPAALDRAGLFVGVCVVVAVATIIQLVGHWSELSARETRLRDEKRDAERRLEAIRAEMRSAVPSEPPVLEFQVDRRTVRIAATEVHVLESAGDYVVVTTTGEKLITKARLSDLAEALGPAGFVRVHRSFVVRVASVEAWNGRELRVAGSAVPVGRTFRSVVREALAGS